MRFPLLRDYENHGFSEEKKGYSVIRQTVR